MARIMVTGAAGFVGSHLVDRLVNDGHEVDAIDDLSGGTLANLAEARSMGGLSFHQIDVRVPEFVELVGRRRPDLIWHLAGRVGRPGSVDDPVGDTDINVLGTLNVLEAVRIHDIAKVGLVVHGLFRREHATDGRTIVGQLPTSPSHIAAEAQVDYVRVHGDIYDLDTRVVALSTVYGPRQAADDAGPCVARFVRSAVNGEPVVIEGDGRQSRDLLFVDDAVDAIVRAADLPAGSIVPVGSGKTVRVGDLAEMVCNMADAGCAPIKADSRPFDRPGIAFPTEDAARRLGWRAYTPIDEGLATTIASARVG